VIPDDFTGYSAAAATAAGALIGLLMQGRHLPEQKSKKANRLTPRTGRG